jgi:hypothetical protein
VCFSYLMFFLHLCSFRELKEGSAYDNLYKSAWCRKAADWIVGINGTKAFTIFHRGIAPFAWSSVRTFPVILSAAWSYQTSGFAALSEPMF